MIHYPAYNGFLDRIVSRLKGAELEFDLISITLKRVADSYDNGEALNAQTLDEISSLPPEKVAEVIESQQGTGSGGAGGGGHQLPL